MRQNGPDLQICSRTTVTANHSTLWYATVFAFLDHHVLGKDWVTPELLR